MPTARRTNTFTESVIREMTRIANEHGALNLAQGMPDFPMPQPMKDAACLGDPRATSTSTRSRGGLPSLRLAIAAKYRRWYDMDVDPERNVTVTCGATEAMAAVFLALVNPGDEVIVFEPYYENYGPDAILAEAKPVFVPLTQPGWRIDEEKLRAAFTSKTKAIIVNTPHNPTGRVFTRDEISLIAELCVKHDVYAFTDEIYEHIRYAGDHHVLATWPGMAERTITISGLSKTFSCTGWRLGYAIAPEKESVAIRKVHDFLTVGAPAPLQEAGAIGMAFDADYYNHLSLEYRARRDIHVRRAARGRLRVHGARGRVLHSRGLLAAERPGRRRVRAVAHARCRRRAGAGVELLSLRRRRRKLVRFAFCKKHETLVAAGERLANLQARV